MTAFAADLLRLGMAGDRRGATVRETGTLPASERRRAAVIVTLVAEYGALVEHVDPVEAQRTVARVRDEAVDVVRRHGGLVNQAIGEEIVALFGVPIAHEDDDLRAVRAAVELRARVAVIPTPAGAAPVRVQSGIHAGPVVAQRLPDGPRRYAIVGACVPVASRLAATASPGEILLSPDCQRLVAPFVHTEACQPIVVEPDGPPITPTRVMGDTGLATRLEASERQGLTPYVGRQSELALLESYVARARLGEGRVITVVGEAGAGKSRLLHELRERWPPPRLRVVIGRCGPHGDATPFFPFIEAVHDALDVRVGARSGTPPSSRRASWRSTPRSRWCWPLRAPAVRAERGAPGAADLRGEHLQAAMAERGGAIVAARASVPLVLLLEDWHWADEASRAAMRHGRDCRGARTAVRRHQSLRARTGRRLGAARISMLPLAPLDGTATTAIAQAMLHVDAWPTTCWRDCTSVRAAIRSSSRNSASRCASRAWCSDRRRGPRGGRARRAAGARDGAGGAAHAHRPPRRRRAGRPARGVGDRA